MPLKTMDDPKNSHKWHSMSVSEVIKLVGADLENGLSEEEARERLERFGPNTVSKKGRKSYLAMLAKQFTDPLILVLIAAVVITLLLRDYVDAGVITAVVLVNAIIGFVQEERAESAIESLSKMLTVESAVVRGGKNIRIPSEQVVPGDVILLQSGDKVPADLRLVELKDLHTDESMLTGESVPVSKATDPCAEDDLVADRTCMAYSGTLVTSGSARAIAVATGDSTELGQISGLISEAPEIATPLTRKLAVFSKWLTAVIVGVSVLIFVVGALVLKQDPKLMFDAAVAIAVAMIPEGLPAVITIVLAVGVKRMAERKAIIRRLPSVETLGSVTTICSDKTGTLTANEMTVRRVYAGRHDFEFEGVGYNPDLCCAVPVDTDESELKTEAFIECVRCGLLCNDSELQRDGDDWRPNGDPTEVALIVAAAKAPIDIHENRKLYRRLDVVPFTSSEMFMATLHDRPEGDRVIYVKGSVERVLDMCADELVSDSDGGAVELDRRHVLDRAEGLARQGFRILAFARKLVPADVEDITSDDCTGMTFLGIQAMSDPPRPEAIDAVKECKRAGIKVKMITGDNMVTAKAIARELGIGGPDSVSITGQELVKLDDAERARTAHDAQIFARVAPEQKYRLVEALQESGEIVAMTGDGVNDAPALKKADVGVAMGKAGSEVAKDAADMILTEDNFASIVAAVEEGRTVFSNLLKSLAFMLPTNAGEGMVIIIALLGGFTLPVTPIQILWINTVTAVTLALPLAFEIKEKGIMDIPPREPDAPMLPWSMVERIILVALCLVAGAFWIFWYEKSLGVSVEQARTAAASTIVAFEMFYLFSARSERTPVWKMGLFTNPYVWVGVCLVTLFQLGFVYLPVMNFFFGSVPLPWEVWWRIIAVSAPIILVVGIEKSIRLRFTSKRK